MPHWQKGLPRCWAARQAGGVQTAAGGACLHEGAGGDGVSLGVAQPRGRALVCLIIHLRHTRQRAAMGQLKAGEAGAWMAALEHTVTQACMHVEVAGLSMSPLPSARGLPAAKPPVAPEHRMLSLGIRAGASGRSTGCPAGRAGKAGRVVLHTSRCRTSNVVSTTSAWRSSSAACAKRRDSKL